MTQNPPPHKKPAAPFNRAADNYIKGPEDVARAIAALRARKPEHKTAAEKAQAEKETHFQTYHRLVAPFVDILRDLPPKDGLAFFSRADMQAAPADRHDSGSLRLWLFYARPARCGFTSGLAPATHSVSVPAKDAQIRQRLTRLALSTRPVLDISVTPDGQGGHRIESHIYRERYVRHNGTLPDGMLPRGDFIEQPETLSRRTHPSLKQAMNALHDWLTLSVPERAEEIRAALSALDTPELKDDVAVLRPATIRRRPKP